MPDLIDFDRTYLPGIGKRTGSGNRSVGAAGSQRKATKMSKQSRYPVYHPTYEELDAILANARAMRARAMRDGLASALGAVKRMVTHRPARQTISEV